MRAISYFLEFPYKGVEQCTLYPDPQNTDCWKTPYYKAHNRELRINFPEHRKDLVSHQWPLFAKTRAAQIPLLTLEKTAATSGSWEPEPGSSWCHFLTAAVKSQRTFVPCNTLSYFYVKYFQCA